LARGVKDLSWVVPPLPLRMFIKLYGRGVDLTCLSFVFLSLHCFLFLSLHRLVFFLFSFAFQPTTIENLTRRVT
jgi:hypothetical protein